MIQILWFAEFQEKVGSRMTQWHETPITVGELKQKLARIYDLPRLTEVMTAVNEEYAADHTILQDDDTVAFIPPVSGG